MTVSTTNRKDQYTGDNSIGQAMPVTFIFFVSSDLTVTERVTATGVDTTLTEGVDYTVAGGSATGATGTVTTVAAVPATKTWTISRDIPRTQPTDLPLNGPLPSDTLETMVDRVVMQSQEDTETVGRALSFPVADSDSLDAELPDSVSRASMSLGFDASGNPVALAGTVSGDVVVTGLMQNLLDDPTTLIARATLVAQEDVITTRGDIVIGDSSGDADRLAIGTTSGHVLMTDGTDPAYTVLPLPAGWLVGFEMSNAADTDHDITFSAGQARGTGDTGNLNQSSAITKQLDTAGGWVVGTDQAGLANAVAIGNDTWYHAFVISTAAGVTDAGFDTSVTAANLLADATGYTNYRRVGSVLTDGSANIIQFIQFDDTFYWTAGIPSLDTTVPATGSDTDYTVDTPLGVRTTARLAVYVDGSAGQDEVLVFPTGSAITTPAVGAIPGTNISSNQNIDVSGQMDVLTNTSSQVSARRGAATPAAFSLGAMGYIDVRGKNDL